MSDGHRTRVVNLRKGGYDVYIGRAGRGQDGYFGNPFRLGRQSRGATIERYRGYFLNRLRNDEQFARRVRELKGKTLGCFCKPHPCHGDVIAEYLDTPVRLAVVGSRTFNDYADALAERYAHERGLPTNVFPADWDTHGKAAGFLRNHKIVAAADEVVAFWDGRSRETQHTIEFARASGEVVYIHGPALFALAGACRSKVVAVEAMVAEDDDRRVVAGELDETAEHHAVETTAPGHHVFVTLETLVRDVRHLLGVVLHERMGKAVARVVIDPQEIPLLVFHEPGGHRVRGGTTGR